MSPSRYDVPATAAPFFSLVHGAWIPYVFARDPETDDFLDVEGPRGFDTCREAVEASRFLARRRAARRSGVG